MLGRNGLANNCQQRNDGVILFHLILNIPGFLLQKKIGVNQPKRIEKARILIANTPMDTDKIKVFGSRVRVDAVSKVADMELAEKEKMKAKVDRIIKHNINVFINRSLI
jgi:T-complex protein 1 subunit beta